MNQTADLIENSAKTIGKMVSDYFKVCMMDMDQSITFCIDDADAGGHRPRVNAENTGHNRSTRLRLVGFCWDISVGIDILSII